MRCLKFHRTLFAVILACILLLCIPLFEPPRKPLADMAAELEAGQFLCEDGSIWQLMGEEGYTPYATVRKVGEIAAETIQNEFRNKVDGAISGAEYAQRVSAYGMVWVDREGGVWKPSKDGSHTTTDGVEFMNLFPFFTLGEIEAEFSLELPLQIQAHSRKFIVPVNGEDEYDGCWFTLSLMLEDGWQVVERGTSYLDKNSVKTGMAEYVFENGNTTTYPVIETSYYYYRDIGHFGNLSLVKVPGRYLLKVYAEQDGKIIRIAQLEMETKIRGSTLYINELNETAAG